MFEGYKYFPEDTVDFLLTEVPAWALIWGDNDGDGTLDFMGDTIRTGDAGLYRVAVDLNTRTYELDRVEWTLYGEATGNADLEMAWNEEREAYEAFVDLQEGNFKFRVNGSSDINLGDDNADAILTQDGADIAVPAGSYQVLLYVDKPDYTYEIWLTSFDDRGMFYTDGQNLEIEDIALFTDGYAINKFKNITRDGALGSDTDFPDTDFPMFRLADVYLMGAEALLRSGGDQGKALDYVNEVRTRAFGSAAGNISAGELDLDYILDERARELYWECHRRTDLIRYGQFTDGNYLWAWKGGVMEGQKVSAHRDVYPIPSSDLGANPNLEQNEGY